MSLLNTPLPFDPSLLANVDDRRATWDWYREMGNRPMPWIRILPFCIPITQDGSALFFRAFASSSWIREIKASYSACVCCLTSVLGALLTGVATVAVFIISFRVKVLGITLKPYLSL